MIVALPPDRSELADAVGPVDGVELVVWRRRRAAAARTRSSWSCPTTSAPGGRWRGSTRLPRLRAVQLQTAGYDGVLELDARRRRLLASARGVHDDATAELALGLTIASLRGIDVAVREAGALAAGHPAPQPGRQPGRDPRLRLDRPRGRRADARLPGAWSPGWRRRLATTTCVGRVVTAADVDWAAQHVVVVVLPLERRDPARRRRGVPGPALRRHARGQRRARPAARHGRRAGRGRPAARSPSTSPTPSRCPDEPSALDRARRAGHAPHRRRYDGDAAPDRRPGPRPARTPPRRPPPPQRRPPLTRRKEAARSRVGANSAAKSRRVGATGSDITPGRHGRLGGRVSAVMTSRKDATSRSMSDSLATIGGASRTVWPWASLARIPLASRASVNVAAGHLVRRDVDAGPQAAGADGVDAVADQAGQPVVQLLAELGRALLELAGLAASPRPRGRSRRRAGCRRTSSRGCRA